ncbi:hypothetical protein MnTg02_00457 [bacterium MnTg02]|nr:hypothetical protein MnTg02_00457 [bacterium MnTg02]
MRIERQSRTRDQERGVQEDIEALEASVVREGPVCSPDCPRARPNSCFRHCPHIPLILTSDPVNEPLEQRIAPLVFELKKLGAFCPCWSCEGHLGPDGKLWKLPAIWFFARSVVHVRLLADTVQDMIAERLLNAHWHVRVCYSDRDNSDTAFSLEPRPSETPLQLTLFHKDIDIMAAQIEKRILKRCREMRCSLDEPRVTQSACSAAKTQF